jgi:hydrogenase large subunit
VASGQLGVFANGYWGHPAMKLPPEANLLGVTHYLEALEWQKEIVKVHAIFGGKNPHPNYLVGGMPCSLNIDEANAINAERLAYVGKLMADAKTFVEQVYIPDLLAMASFYKDWAAIGGGLRNYMATATCPRTVSPIPASSSSSARRDSRSRLDQNSEVDAHDPQQVSESIAHSWYEYSDGDGVAKHPWDGETKLNYTGPQPPYDQLNVAGKYSWLKTPRWKDHAMEVGPFARMLVGYGTGRTDIKDAVNMVLKKLDVPVAALFSTLGRTAARGIETYLVAQWSQEFYGDLLANIKNGDSRTFNNEKWEPSTWPSSAKGVGMSEAPRGALAHWIVIQDQKIANYQLVVPSTWNASPRDSQGQRSAYEASLIGTPVADPDQPLEIIRTIHSFDPCLACAVHLYDPHGRTLNRITIGG